MKANAKLKYLRIAPRKVRLVADLIRGKQVSEALSLLEFTQKGATKPLKKLLESAIANARSNFGLSESNLFVSKIVVNEGPTLKRVRARAFGRFFPIHKRSSHVELVLEEIEKGKTIRSQKAIGETEAAEAVKAAETKEETGQIGEKKDFKKSKESFRLDKFKPRIKETTRKFFRRKAF